MRHYSALIQQFCIIQRILALHEYYVLTHFCSTKTEWDPTLSPISSSFSSCFQYTVAFSYNVMILTVPFMFPNKFANPICLHSKLALRVVTPGLALNSTSLDPSNSHGKSHKATKLKGYD